MLLGRTLSLPCHYAAVKSDLHKINWALLSSPLTNTRIMRHFIFDFNLLDMELRIVVALIDALHAAIFSRTMTLFRTFLRAQSNFGKTERYEENVMRKVFF